MENFVTVIGVVVALFTIFKIINEITLSRTSKHRQDYSFTKDYLQDLNNPDIHRYIIEKGFRALTNDVYSVEEIKHLFSFSQPSEAIFLRASGKKMLKFDIVNDKYDWIGIYKNSYFRAMSGYFFIIAYGVSALSCILPFLLNKNLDFGVVMFSISMGVIAVGSVIKNSDFADSIKFMQLTPNLPS